MNLIPIHELGVLPVEDIDRYAGFNIGLVLGELLFYVVVVSTLL